MPPSPRLISLQIAKLAFAVLVSAGSSGLGPMHSDGPVRLDGAGPGGPSDHRIKLFEGSFRNEPHAGLARVRSEGKRLGRSSALETPGNVCFRRA